MGKLHDDGHKFMGIQSEYDIQKSLQHPTTDRKISINNQVLNFYGETFVILD